MDLQLAH
jgi:hypothetical protein